VLSQLEALVKQLEKIGVSVKNLKDSLKAGDIEGNELYIYREILYPLQKELSGMMDYVEFGSSAPAKELTEEQEAEEMEKYKEELGTRFPGGELSDREVRWIRDFYEKKFPQLFNSEEGMEFTQEELEGIQHQYKKLYEDRPPGTPKREILREILYPIIVERNKIFERELNF
jgi:hypothetical protein